MPDNVLLSVEEMYAADKAAEAAGVPSLDLMEAAGRAIAIEIAGRWEPRPVVVLAGPGNNGGDGFVAARLLADAGWPVSVALLGAMDKLPGDAAHNAGRWTGEVAAIGDGVDAGLGALLDGGPVIVDALFGAGLSRPISGSALAAVEAVNARGLDCIAVDIASGIDGNSGAVLGGAVNARVTVTFFRPKPGHYLLPGRERAGELVVADIGIPDSVLDAIQPRTYLNGPALWIDRFPWPDAADHKYSRGHAVVAGGVEMTGAARLAAMGARRCGAGLVTIAAPSSAFAVYAAEEPGTLVKAIDDTDGFRALVGDSRKNAVVVGPGAGVSAETRGKVLAALGAGKATVIDADGLSAFADAPDALFDAIKGSCVLTPHEGEFKRLFDFDGAKPERTRTAAKSSGAVVLLKGADTVIAAPDGRAAINTSGTPDLATAGSGDVLAGMILGLLSQGMDAFNAACAAAWLHGVLAEGFGPGLIAEDLPARIPEALKALKGFNQA